MSVFSRILLAGLACASLVGVQAASAQATTGDEPSHDTGGRFFHATKCLTTMGFGRGCDKDAPAPKTPVSNDGPPDTSTRHQFMRASRCVVTMGFAGDCDKDAPGGSSSAGRRADAGPPVRDASTRGQFVHASKCLITMGFGSNCDQK